MSAERAQWPRDELAAMVAPMLVEGIADEVAIEEPLEIRVDGRPLAITMRTPGHDEELALGFLHGEGLIGDDHPGVAVARGANVIDVAGPLLRKVGERTFYTSSSCGICGRASLAEVALRARRAQPGPSVTRALLAGLPLRMCQPAFTRTGGTHATCLFDDVGTALLAREDVGRHNAMDKVLGAALRAGLLPLRGRMLCVSGRLSFELVQKAALAGVPILVGAGAPSSLAIALAERCSITLAGFAQGDRINLYAGAERVSDGRITAGARDDRPAPGSIGR